MFDPITIKDTKNKIGEWCRLKRKTQKLSQNELSDLLGVSRVTIQNIETGKNITLDSLLKIMNYFDDLNKMYRLFDQDILDNNITSLY